MRRRGRHAADVFSLGCVLHQLLVNEAPHWPLPKREPAPDMLPAPVANPLFTTDLHAITQKRLPLRLINATQRLPRSTMILVVF